MKKGFTLSEVLITLGVIGIVSVLTVPAVMKNYRNRLYVAQLKKIQAQISDAATSMMNDSGVSSLAETKISTACAAGTPVTECKTGIQFFLNTYFKTIKKNCGTNRTNPCVAAAGQYRHLDGSGSLSLPNDYCIQTINGQTICGFYNNNNHCLSVMVDVNGQGQPNTIGRDVFAMDVHRDTKVSDYNSGCSPDSEGFVGCNAKKDSDSIYKNAAGCFNAVKDAHWEMNY